MTMPSHTQPSIAPIAAGSIGLAIGAMVSFQLAVALSRPLTAEIGAPAVTWIRMATAAFILIAVTRPKFGAMTRQAIWPALLLGGTLALMSVAFLAAANRLPLGLVATISFMGPLSVAVLTAPATARPLALGLAMTAAVGVLLILAPHAQGGESGWDADGTGLVYAVIAAISWAVYIILLRRVGTVFAGTDGLSVSLLAAALLLTPTGLVAFDHPPPLSVLLGSAGLALLAPLLTCCLELKALRQLGTQCFGILMSLEPAIAALLGFALLHEIPTAQQFLGMVYVVVASAGTVRLAK